MTLRIMIDKILSNEIYEVLNELGKRNGTGPRIAVLIYQSKFKYKIIF